MEQRRVARVSDDNTVPASLSGRKGSMLGFRGSSVGLYRFL